MQRGSSQLNTQLWKESLKKFMLAGIWTLCWSRGYQCSALTNWANKANGSWLFQSLFCIAKRDEGQLMNIYSISLCYVLMLFLVFSYTCILFCVWLIIYVQFNFSCDFCHLLSLKLIINAKSLTSLKAHFWN